MEITPEIQSTLAKGITLLAVMLSTGFLVRYSGVKVNYTRKVNHFAIFFLPVFIDKQFDAETFTNFVYLAISAVITTVSLLMFYEPIRKLIPPYQLMFEGFDRPEDRPYTLVWIWTQFAAGFAVMLPMIWLFGQWGLGSLVLIPILINVVGDGLAEPVGIRFGKHEPQRARRGYRRHGLYAVRGLPAAGSPACRCHHACVGVPSRLGDSVWNRSRNQ